MLTQKKKENYDDEDDERQERQNERKQSIAATQLRLCFVYERFGTGRAKTSLQRNLKRKERKKRTRAPIDIGSRSFFFTLMEGKEGQKCVNITMPEIVDISAAMLPLVSIS